MGNSCLLKFLASILNIVPLLFFTAVFNLRNCKFENLAFILLYSTIFISTYDTLTVPLLNSKTVFFSFSKTVIICAFTLLSSLNKNSICCKALGSLYKILCKAK